MLLRWNISAQTGDGLESLIVPVPEDWGNGSVTHCYMHGTFPLNLTQIRRRGLMPTKGPAEPFAGYCVYCSKNRTIPFWTYCAEEDGTTIDAYAQKIPVVNRAFYTWQTWQHHTREGGRHMAQEVPTKSLKCLIGIAPTVLPLDGDDLTQY